MVSSGIMCGTRWGGRLGALPGWDFMSSCGFTLGCDEGAASGVVFGVCTLGGGVTSGRVALVNISASFLRAAVCLSPNIVSVIVGVGLRRVWVRSAAACVAAYFEDSIFKVSVFGKFRSVGDSLFCHLGDVGH